VEEHVTMDLREIILFYTVPSTKPYWNTWLVDFCSDNKKINTMYQKIDISFLR
jgi:hypothetical protein